MSKKFEKKEVTVIKERCVATYCDTCGIEISKPDGDYKWHYYHVTTSHNNWGNDSHESIENFDFCSYACLNVHQDEYFKNARSSEEYEILRKEIPEQQLKYRNEK